MIAIAGRRPLALLAVLSLAVLDGVCPDIVHAQAWVPVRREASVSLIVQKINFRGHFDTDGSRLTGCLPSRAYVAIADVEYGLTDKLAVGARLPYIASRFTGAPDEPCAAFVRQSLDEARRLSPGRVSSTTLDTGSYYATFQDVGLTLRYNLLDKGIVVTPVVGATIPSHHYQTIGEAAPGQDRRALQVGVNVGRLLDPVLPHAYVQASYTYAFVEHLFGISLDRSTVDLEGGYAVTPIVTVRVLATWLHTHGGLTFAQALDRGLGLGGQPPEPDLFLDHDRLLASRYWHVGGGATVALTDSMDLDAAVLTFVSGADSHYGVGATVGMTWHFKPTASASPSGPARVH